METGALARAYYEAVDEDDYDLLRDVLAPDFVQERGDRTFESREAFVRFMREERPEKDTVHEIDHVTADGDRVVVEGTLRRASGEVWFRFADAFAIEDGRMAALRTYSI